MALTIAIDGPAASGKSTVARRLAARLNAWRLNTGDMYRAVTWAALRRRIDPEVDPAGVVALLDSLSLEVRPDNSSRDLNLVLDGAPVPQKAVRSPEVAAKVSYVARLPAVRTWLVARQRTAAGIGPIVMEGRDIGTVVLPDADAKFFITASRRVRAERRLAQAGETAPDATVESVAADIAVRDLIDSIRDVAPLRPAEDACVIDTSDMTVDEVLRDVLRHLPEPLQP